MPQTHAAQGRVRLAIEHRADGPRSTLRAEVAVVGSGPGGAITACLLAEAGRDVLLIEEGPFVPPDAVAPFSLDEMVAKYRNGGITVALGPAKVAYVEGRCVGGGSEINSGLYHRTPADVLARWRRDYGVAALTEDNLRPHFEAAERDLSVGRMPGPAPSASRKLRDGADRLGWRSLEVPRWYRYDEPDPIPSPASSSASSRGTKQTMSRTYIPRAVEAGARLVSDTRVASLRREGASWVLRCRPTAGPDRTPFRAEAGTVFVCGGAIQTPALLRRSGLTRNIGDALRMHPTVKVTARFPEPVNEAGLGVPVHQVKEFAPRISFGGSISSPAYLALALCDHPQALATLDRDWPHLASYYAMISGQGRGTLRVIPGLADPVVRYGLTDEDMVDLASGLERLCRLLLHAGAVELFPGLAGAPPIRSEADLRRLPAVLPRARANLMTIHLTSSCPFGEDRRRCAADSFGKVHGADDLYIADASLLCTQPGVNPQGTIMALARRNALRFLGHL